METDQRTTDPGMVYLLLLLEGRGEGILVVHRNPRLGSDFLREEA